MKQLIAKVRKFYRDNDGSTVMLMLLAIFVGSLLAIDTLIEPVLYGNNPVRGLICVIGVVSVGIGLYGLMDQIKVLVKRRSEDPKVTMARTLAIAGNQKHDQALRYAKTWEDADEYVDFDEM